MRLPRTNYRTFYGEGRGQKEGLAHSGDTSAYAGAPTGVAGFFAGFWGDAAQWFRKACLKRRSTGVVARAFLWGQEARCALSFETCDGWPQ